MNVDGFYTQQASLVDCYVSEIVCNQQSPTALVILVVQSETTPSAAELHYQLRCVCLPILLIHGLVTYTTTYASY